MIVSLTNKELDAIIYCRTRVLTGIKRRGRAVATDYEKTRVNSLTLLIEKIQGQKRLF